MELQVCPTCSCRGSSYCQDRWHEQMGLAYPGQYDFPHPGEVARRATDYTCPTCGAPPRTGCYDIFLGPGHPARDKLAREAIIGERARGKRQCDI
jgi:hypothetical protein